VNDKGAAPPRLLDMLHTTYAAEAEMESRLSRVGLSLAKLAALTVLDDAGESLPLSQIAARLSCVKSNITQLVDRLETDGLVARRTDPHDRRAIRAELTAAGRKAVAEGTRVQQETERALLKGLTRGEVEQLQALLAKVGASG
jgi:DNA-binding MarR family transcriptional regulator